jgi:hypothetical protein
MIAEMMTSIRGFSSVRFSRFLPLAALVVAGCSLAEDPAPLFEPTGTGDVSGFLFFDADANGQFTPIGGDTALAGVKILVRERGSEVAIDSTVTEAGTGAFSFEGLPPGTHDIFIVRDPATTGALLFCTNPLRASVYVGEQAFFPVVARTGCVKRIAIAKDTAQGNPVTVAGIVTAAQGTYRSDNAVIQDPTGGILIFGLSGAANLQLGDSVEVSGTLSNFGGELQIVSPQVAPTRRSGVPVPEPDTVTTGSLASATPTSPAIGRLITVTGVTVGEFTTGGTPPRNAPIDDGSGAIQIRLDGNTLGVITTARFQTGRCYDITGILGINNGTVQLKPRMVADVVEVTCPAP